MNSIHDVASKPTSPVTRLLTRIGLAAAVLCTSQVYGQNLLVNGNFSGGNSGFTTDYTLTTMTPYLFQDNVHGIYAIEPIGSVAGSSAYGDWTNVTTLPAGGNGNVFVADGATTASTRVWTETLTVTPGTPYNFSYYAAEISNPCCSNASFVASINGTSGGVLNAIGAWQQSPTFTWNSGASTSATLTLIDTNLSGPYNDFVLTDISFTAPPTAVPEPASWMLMLLGLCLAPLALRRRVVTSA